MNYYADKFNGGYCFNGYSPGYNGGGQLNVAMPIPNFSQERRTFLFAHRVGNAPPITITVQGQPFTFNSSNQATPTFQSSVYGGNSGVHAIDITGIFNININNFVFNIPSQGASPSNRYTGFVLYRSFLKANADTMNAYIELNQYNYQPISPTWQVNMPSPLQPISTTFPVTLGLCCDYLCDCDSDWTKVFVNGNPLLGTIGGNPTGYGICGGTTGSHLYWGSIFTPLLNNNTNLAMNCTDALSDIRTRVNTGDLTFALNLNAESSPPNFTNCVWAAIGGYKGTGSPSPYECPDCGSYTVTNLLSTSATLNWSSCAPHGSSFINDVQYRAVGSPTWITTTVTTDSFLNISGLTSGIQYEWQVINVDSDGAICEPSDTQTFITP